MISASKWISSHFGKGYDVDGYYKYQCWDLFAQFCNEVGYPLFNCTTTGYVRDLWDNRKTSGILNYFNVCSKKRLQKGDWIIWTESPYGTGNSHIAMFVEYKGNKVKVLGQNQTADQKASYATLTTNGIGGCLRPKCWVSKYNPTFYNIRVRELQNAMNKDIKAKLNNDGWCGNNTQNAMKTILIKPYPDESYNDCKNVVKFLQKYLGCTQDGLYGPNTTKAVKQWQKKMELTQNGCVGFTVLYWIARNGK